MTPGLSRPALRYFGSKWLLAPWLIEHMPAHHAYVELFGGGGALLLRKPQSPIEVYNDIDGQIVNFFRVVRERPDELIRALELTPYSRAELNLSYEDAEEPIEAARRTFVRMWQGHGGSRASWRTGWRYQRSLNQRRSIIDNWLQHERLADVALRLREAQLECGDAFAVIKKFDTPETLFYADPPYLPETRSERWRANGYGQHEMDEADHQRLATALSAVEGMVMLSGYASPLYERLYAGWAMHTRTMAVDGRVHRGNGTQRKRVECLWLSPKAAARARQLRMEEAQ